MVLIKRCFFVSAIFAAILAVGFFEARADSALGRYADRNLDVEGLILDWKSYLQSTILVDGSIHCADEDYCSFEPVPGFRRIVRVDIVMLTSEEKRYLIEHCEELSCKMTILGDVLSDTFMARKISYVSKE